MTEIDEKPLRRRLSGDHNQCPSCGLYFNSTASFDAHRAGKWGTYAKSDGSYIPAERRCLTEQEMREKGMSVSASGWWITSKRPV